MLEDQQALSTLPTVVPFAPFEVVPLFLGDPANPQRFAGWSFTKGDLPAPARIEGEAPYLRFVANRTEAPVAHSFQVVSARQNNLTHTVTFEPEPLSPPQELSTVGVFPLSKLNLYFPPSQNAGMCNLWLGLRPIRSNKDLIVLIRDFDGAEMQRALRVAAIPRQSSNAPVTWFHLRAHNESAQARTIRILEGDQSIPDPSVTDTDEDKPTHLTGEVTILSDCALTEFGFSGGHEFTTISRATVGNRGELFFTAPPNLESLRLMTIHRHEMSIVGPNGAAISYERGSIAMSASPVDVELPSATVSVPLVLSHQWRGVPDIKARTFTLRRNSPTSSTALSRIRGMNFPLILYTSRSALEELGGGFLIHRGFLVNHRYQTKLIDGVRTLLDQSPATSTLIPDFNATFGSLPDTSFPTGLHRVFGVEDNHNFSSIQALMRALIVQNVDSNHLWYGAPAFWPPSALSNNLGTRWDRFEITGHPWITNGLPMGMSHLMPQFFPSIAEAAALITFNNPVNPFYNSQPIANRLIAGSLFLFSSPRHSEFGAWGGGYAGGHFFSMREFAEVYYHLSHMAPADIRAAWTEGLRNLYYYYLTSSTLGAANQTFYYLLPLMQFGIASPNPVDRILAEWRLDRTLDSQHSEGYFSEAYGDDGIYNSDSRRDLAAIFNLDRHSAHFKQRVLPAIHKSYALNQRMYAPEPGLSTVTSRKVHFLGASSSFYRTPWPAPNWWWLVDGAIDELVPAAALVMQTHGSAAALGSPQARKSDWSSRNQQLRTFLLNSNRLDLTECKSNTSPCQPENALRFGRGLALFRNEVLPPLSNPVHPALSPLTPMVDEGINYLTIKRDYYATLYSGRRTDPQNPQIRNPSFSAQDAVIPGYFSMLPSPNNEENTGFAWDYNQPIRVDGQEVGRTLTVPYNGGGLTLLHHPASGVQLSSMNWSPLVQHGTVLIMPEDGRRLFTAYDSVNRTIATAGQDPQVNITARLIPANIMPLSNPSETPGELSRILNGGPIEIRRNYTFRKSEILVQLTVINTDPNQSHPYGRIIEVIPVPVKVEGEVSMITVQGAPAPTTFAQRPGGADGPIDSGFSEAYASAFAALWPSTPRQVNGTGVSIRRGTERPFTIALDRARTMAVQMNGMHMRGDSDIRARAPRIGRIEIELAREGSLAPGQSLSLTYRLQP